jgi:hypothetical protein
MGTQTFATPKEGFKQTQTLHLALILGLVLMSSMLWLTISTDEVALEQTILSQVLPIVLAGLIVVAFYVYKMRIANQGELTSLLEKVEHYRASNIIKWALMEGAGLMSMLFYFFIEDGLLFPVIFGCALLGLAYSRPSIDQFAKDYNLTNQESSELK